MLTVDEARDKILAAIGPLDPIELPLSEVAGCVTASDVIATEDLPTFPSSAMDGFAVRSSDTASAHTAPLGLSVVGESAAGRPFDGRVASGEAVRIFTGAAIPEGADAVIPQEDVAAVGSSVAIGRPVQPGTFVRPAGQDVRVGETVIGAGRRLRGMDVGVCAALGRTRVEVHPRPRVLVLSNGDELREPGVPLTPGLVRDSNSYALSGMVREAGLDAVRLGIVGDSPNLLREKITHHLPQADCFLISGGVSVGDHDHVREVVEQMGSIEFWKVAVKPGKPIAFGLIDGRPFFGLPGNPASAVVTFELFVRPALLRMAGRRVIRRPETPAILEDAAPGDKARETWLRVSARRTSDGFRAVLAGGQGSNLVGSIARCNALACIPAGTEAVRAGDQVRLMLLDSSEDW